jgi:hypothetical protein
MIHPVGSPRAAHVKPLPRYALCATVCSNPTGLYYLGFESSASCQYNYVSAPAGLKHNYTGGERGIDSRHPWRSPYGRLRRPKRHPAILSNPPLGFEPTFHQK